MKKNTIHALLWLCDTLPSSHLRKIGLIYILISVPIKGGLFTFYAYFIGFYLNHVLSFPCFLPHPFLGKVQYK